MINPTTQIVYRSLTACDADAYHRIRLECLQNHSDHFGDTCEEESGIGATHFVNELADNNNGSFWYGAFALNQLVGISGFVRQKRTRAKHRGDLIQVYTDPRFTRNGIGTKLIKLTIDRAFENPFIEQVLLSVVHSNNKAISLYKKFGFVQYGFIENYFKRDDVYSSQLFMALTRYDYDNLPRIRKEQAFIEFFFKLRSV